MRFRRSPIGSILGATVLLLWIAAQAPPADARRSEAGQAPGCSGRWKVQPAAVSEAHSATLFGVSAISSTDVWAVGQYVAQSLSGLAEHWDGTAWTAVTTPNPKPYQSLLAVSALTSTDVWAVGSWNFSGYRTLVEHWDGELWSIVSSPSVGSGTNVLQGVAAVSPSDVWAVGYYVDSSGVYKTLIEHWDGSSWSIVSSPSPGSTFNTLAGVDVSSANDVWAVGQTSDNPSGSPGETLVEHWDGSTWEVVPSPNAGTEGSVLLAVSATGSDAWAVGLYENASGTPLTLTEHWDGSKWTVVPSPSPGAYFNVLQSVSITSTGGAWAAGAFSSDLSLSTKTLIEQWDGVRWRQVRSPNLGMGPSYLYSVSTVGADAWAVGQHDSPDFKPLIERFC